MNNFDNIDTDDLIVYEGKKKKTSGSGTKVCRPLENDDTTLLLTMAIDTAVAHMGRPAEYPATQKGLDDFVQQTIDYFEHVRTVNSDPELKQKIIPDVESWSVFLGISRVTLWKYAKRNKEWAETIDYYKTVIQATRKQLAACYKIPPAVFVFDSVNNFDYLNVTEFKINTTVQTEEVHNNIDDQLRENNLTWNEETGTFEPADN